MKESLFIEKNKARWKQAEDLLAASKVDAEQLSKLFISITDDLSYAKTFYPNRYINRYLNNLTNTIYQKIRIEKSNNVNSLFRFWTEELPPLIWSIRKELLFALGLFLLMVGIGIFSSIYNKEFVFQILGAEYVDETIANIRKGDPMAIYKSAAEMDMFYGISLNNIKVAILSFMGGLIFGLGSVMIIIYNGIMVGVFQYFFIEYGLGIHSASTIWLHGTIEISCLVIAGGAGLSLGNAIIFPGSYSRWDNFLRKGKSAFLVMIGIIPLIVAAAFIESFITRYSMAPLYLKFVLIFLSLFFVIYVFVCLPYKNRNVIPNWDNIKNAKFTDRESLDLKTTGGRLVYNFKFIQFKLPNYILISSLISGLWAFLHWYYIPETEVQHYSENIFEQIKVVFYNSFKAFHFNSIIEKYLFILAVAIIQDWIIPKLIDSFAQKLTPIRRSVSNFFLDLVKLILINFVLTYLPILLYTIFLPIFIMLFYAKDLYQEPYQYSDANHRDLLGHNIIRFILVVASSVLLLCIWLIFFQSPIMYFTTKALYTLIGSSKNIWVIGVVNMLPFFLAYMVYFIFLPFILLTLFVYFLDALEINQFALLKKRIAEISI